MTVKVRPLADHQIDDVRQFLERLEDLVANMPGWLYDESGLGGVWDAYNEALFQFDQDQTRRVVIR